ncbi:MAG: nucleotidyl transferase AbiEii/AbiGii toxin family protein [Muribaculaceae bacterium]|nr:nucleotidyl transferase AbiEii/AbiGii toxin family protein [Muribaculaceae bacterium]MDE5975867.1 nucleotidyl transferase AbiEii/AbiGii toxin family protein [Muribaculaceae bacterium]MDE6299195.1 nucleotidyl transferase AbiEii/AbiGii toxin family protein [Muribaculaceae bacterium]
MTVNKKALAPHTSQIIESISKLDCIRPYLLVGGTALSLQLGTRQSEDLDFMSWRISKTEKREVDWPKIKRELEGIGEIDKMEILDLDHVEFVINKVKLSFYANPNYSPVKEEISLINNLRLADLISIGAMKMEVLLRRSKFRDYYDIYSLLEADVDLHSMIDLALKYSGHKLKSKNLLALLTRGDRFREDENFKSLKPIYEVTSKDIEERIKRELLAGGEK